MNFNLRDTILPENYPCDSFRGVLYVSSFSMSGLLWAAFEERRALVDHNLTNPVP